MRVFDAVSDTPDGGAEVRGVVCGEVGGFGGEVEDEVVVVDEEFLEDGARGEEFEGGGGHDCRVYSGCGMGIERGM